MWRKAFLCAMAIGLPAWGSGCACRDRLASGQSAATGCTLPEGTIAAQRPAPLTPDVTALVSYHQPVTAWGAALDGSACRVLDACLVQCRAAANSPIANALGDESGIGSEDDRKSCDRSTTLKRQIMAYRALEERNHTAAAALELFYRLAELETNGGLARLSQQRINTMVGEAKQLREQGIHVEKPLGELAQQSLAAQGRQADSDLAQVQVNGRLRGMVGLDCRDQMPLWPAADLTVIPETIDREAAICTGLTYRADLAALRTLSQSIDIHTLATVRSSLSGVSGLLGSSKAGGRHKIPTCGSVHEEIQTRRQQVAQLAAAQERQVTEEVRQAIYAIEVHLQQITIANAKVTRCQEQCESLAMRRQMPEARVTSFDHGFAELKLLEARAELVHQVVAWRIAQVKLKEAQGVLPIECGYCLP
jgi:hypothetical protein